MNALTHRIGIITNLDNLGRFASVKIDNKIYNFTTDSLLPHVLSTFKVHKLYQKYREQVKLLSAWYDARVKGKSDRRLLKSNNPFKEEREITAWLEGWKEEDLRLTGKLQFLLTEKLFREGRLTHNLLTLISEKRWDELLHLTEERPLLSRYVYLEDPLDNQDAL
jgi:hypothetical protein